MIISKSLSSKSRYSVSHFSSDTPLKKEVNVSSSVLGTKTFGDETCSVLYSSPINYNKLISLNKNLSRISAFIRLFDYRDLITSCPRKCYITIMAHVISLQLKEEIAIYKNCLYIFFNQYFFLYGTLVRVIGIKSTKICISELIH